MRVRDLRCAGLRMHGNARRRTLPISIITAIFLATAGTDASDRTAGPYAFDRMHQAGGRIGAWINLGETPPSSRLVNGSDEFLSDISSSSAYFEATLAYRIARPLMFELAFGSVNRGTITLVEGDDEIIGNLLISPILAQVRVYPFSPAGGWIQPWTSGGGGVMYARRSAQFVNLSDFGFASADFTDNDEVQLVYALSGGIDFRVGRHWALEAATRWTPVTFPSGLALVEKFDQVVVTVGIKYLIPSLDKGKPRRP